MMTSIADSGMDGCERDEAISSWLASTNRGGASTGLYKEVVEVLLSTTVCAV